ncbi:hypothetical protein B296_00019660 [Ensete ventricosum]|uniref:Uncharacterized protein n=1 Tax=Ensete ventricosum TaxID=4639 RepID=A0A427ADQ0_ENSVE|nr:hypothetical protein B296_00019660 [Ensete ventricosum]
MPASTFHSREVACRIPCLKAAVPRPRHGDTHHIPSHLACLGFSLFHYMTLQICRPPALPLRLYSDPFLGSLLPLVLARVTTGQIELAFVGDDATGLSSQQHPKHSKHNISHQAAKHNR